MKALKIILLFAHIFCFSQNKIDDFPSITKDEYIKTKSSIKEDAPAEILYRYENYRISQQQEVEIVIFNRIKIFNKNLSEEYLNLEIPLYEGKTEREKIDFLDARTYNEENGEVVITTVDKNAQYKSKINENYNSLKFAFPNVKDGSILEYIYIIKSPYIRELPKVYFEEKIPQKYIEYNLICPETVGYTLNLNGKLKESEKSLKTESHLGAIYSFWKYIYKDVKPYFSEKFVKNINDYRSSIRPELNSVNNLYRIKMTTSWDQVRRKLLIDSRFGRELDYEDLIRNILPKEIFEDKNKLSKANKILNFVQTNYLWDERDGIFVDKGLENLVKKKKGNVAEINLLLTSLMRRAGLNANPVILSTTDNGSLNVKFPTMTMLNYVITCLEDGGKIYLYDGTSKLTKENMLSPRIYNNFGVLIGENETKIVNLPNTVISKSILNLNVVLNENGIINGKFSDTETKLNAIFVKEKFNENKEQLSKDIKDKYPFNEENINIDFSQDDVLLTFDFKADNLVDKIKDKIIFNPLLFLYSQNHDFNQKEIRSFPIEFISPYETSKKVTIEIPQNYKFVNLPKSKKIKTEDDGIIYSYNITINENKITVETSVKIDSDTFPKEYYPAFKQIFDNITKLEGQLVTVVKK